MELEEKLIYYILEKVPDQHPFRLSRYLLLLELEYQKRFGERLTNFEYRLSPRVFQIEGFPQFLESLKKIEKRVQKDEKGIPIRGYFTLTERVGVELSREIKGILDPILEETGKLSDHELNLKVVEREDYKGLIESAK